MMNSDTFWFLAAFVIYLAVMLVIGAYCMKRNKSADDFFLGGRGLSGWVAALSAQASDMSGWLLMGLPGAVYALGTGQAWIAVGLFLGTVFNWLCISRRLRRYTIRANNAITFPEYMENRFHDKKQILLLISSIVIVIFFLVYTASALAAGGKLFASVFHMDYRIALTIGAVVILAYTFMGGFLAVCATDFVQGMMMLVALLVVPIGAYILMSPDGFMANLSASIAPQATDGFLSMIRNGDRNYSAVEIISQLGWGLGYCGMPHILTRFMAVRSEKELKKSKVIAIIWVAISLGMAVIIGIVGRAYLFPTLLGTSGADSSENVFILMITKLFTEDVPIPFIGGIFLCGILAAIMSTADSQLLITASSASKDLYQGVINKKASDKKMMTISRITVIVVAVLAYIIALDPESSIMDLVSNAWAGLGAAFGPTVLLSLFWKRTNLAGAVAGIISGGLTVIIWDYIPLVGGETLGTATGLYSLVVGFAVSLILIAVVSLCTKEPDAQMIQEFEDVAAGRVEK